MAIANITNNILTDSGVLVSSLPSGSGTTNYLPKWTSGSALGDSLIYDNGTNVGIGTTTNAVYKLDVNGTIRSTSSITASQFYASNTNGISLIDNAVGAFLSYAYNSGRTNAAGHYFYNGITTEIMRLDASGNLGLGVIPSAWATLKGFEIGTIGNGISGYIADAGIYVTSNAYYNAGWKYATSSKLSTRYSAESGVHSWAYAPSGTADSAITFTQAMTLTANGNLLLGTTTDNGTDRLQVSGSGYFTGIIKTNSLVDGGAFKMIYSSASASSRSWQINNDAYQYGDFAISQSTTQTGTTFNQRLIISSAGDVTIGSVPSTGTGALYAGAATFSSSVTASSLIKSGGTSAQILAADGSVITAGTNITISGGTISASGGGGSMAIGGSITSATAGSVLFAGTSGVLQQDNANFFWDDSTNRLGIGTNNPQTALSVIGDGRFNGSLSLGYGATDSAMEIGLARTVSGYAFIDLIGDTTYSDYGLRIIRNNTGANTPSDIIHRGTGLFTIRNIEAASLAFATSNVIRGIFTAAGTLAINNNPLGDPGTYKLIVGGATNITGGDLRVDGDATTSRGINIINGTVGASASAVMALITDAGTVAFTKNSTINSNFVGLGGFAITNSSGGTAGNMGLVATGGSATSSLILSNAGALTLSYNFNSGTSFTISNTTSGTASESKLTLTSDASSGSGFLGKYSTTTTPYKILASKDTYWYNSSTAGDITILNDFASGTIKMAAGGSSVSHVTISATGLTTFSTGIVYKRLNPITTTVASTATLTPDISLGDTFTITAQAAALSVANPTGTPVNGQKMTIRIKDNGTARAITWSATANGYRASTDLALPTTTIINKTMYLGFIWNSTDSKWDLLAFLNNF